MTQPPGKDRKDTRRNDQGNAGEDCSRTVSQTLIEWVGHESTDEKQRHSKAQHKQAMPHEQGPASHFPILRHERTLLPPIREAIQEFGLKQNEKYQADVHRPDHPRLVSQRPRIMHEMAERLIDIYQIFVFIA